MTTSSFSCFLCALPTTTPPSSRQEEDDQDTPPLLKAQLEVFYLVSSLLKIPSSECVSLLSTFGHPGEWLSLCPSCQGRLREAYRLNQKVQSLVKKIEEVKETLLRPLILVKTEADDGEEVITGDIHTEGDDGGRKAGARIRQLAVKVNKDKFPGGFFDTLNFEDEDTLFSTLIGQDQDDDDDDDPLLNLNDFDFCIENDKEETKDSKIKILPIFEEDELMSICGSSLFARIFDGTYYTCPMSDCTTQRGYNSKRSFRDHVRRSHPLFLAHFEEELHPEHKCEEDACLPKLLLKPRAFLQKRQRIRKRTDEIYKKRKKEEEVVQKNNQEEEAASSSSSDDDVDASATPSEPPLPPKTLQELQSLPSSTLWTLLFNGSYYTCPMPSCRSGSRRGYPSKKSFRDHVWRYHGPFIAHLQICLPPEHDCAKGQEDCRPSLLLNPALYSRRQRRISNNQNGRGGKRKMRKKEVSSEDGLSETEEEPSSDEDEDDASHKLTLSQIQALSGPQLMETLFDGSYYICPMSGCSTRRGYNSRKSFTDHARTYHAPFLAHIQRMEAWSLPPNHGECRLDVCLPSLLTNPQKLMRRAKRLRTKNDRLYAKDEGGWGDGAIIMEQESMNVENLTTMEEIQSLPGPVLFRKLFDGSYYTCPMPKCSSLRSYNSKKSFSDHVRNIHAPFLPHLQRVEGSDPLPLDHKCEEALCLPSLLLNAVEFQKKQKRLRDKSDQFYGISTKCKDKEEEDQNDEEEIISKIKIQSPSISRLSSRKSATTNRRKTSPSSSLDLSESEANEIHDDDEEEEDWVADEEDDDSSSSPVSSEENEDAHSDEEEEEAKKGKKMKTRVKTISWNFLQEVDDSEIIANLEEIRSLSAPQMWERLSEASSFYTCPVSSCTSRRGFGSKRSLMDHVRRYHLPFLPHLQPTALPDHVCCEEECPLSTSLLLRPAAFAKKQRSVTPPEEEIKKTTKNERETLQEVADWTTVLKIKETEIQERLELKEILPKAPQIKRKKQKNGLSSLSRKYRVSSFPCTKCPSTTFTTYKEWTLHQNHAHNPGFPCSSCGKNVFTVQSLENHTRVAHGAKEWDICSGCRVSFKGSDYFNTHLRKEGVDSACIKNAVSCPNCPNFKLENAHTLAIHTRIKHETTYERPYKCDQCPRSFTTKKHLRAHMESHGDGAVCSECGKMFGSGFHMNEHRKAIHSRPKQAHPCSICGRTFPSRHGVTRHMALHRPDNPFVCPICGKGFKLKNYLTIHSWSHDPEKRGKYAEYNERLKNNTKRVRRGRRERVEVVVVKDPEEPSSQSVP